MGRSKIQTEVSLDNILGSPNSDIVPASGYTVLTDIDTTGFQALAGSREQLISEYDARVRQDGEIVGVTLKTGTGTADANFVGIFLTVWRKNSKGTFDKIGQSNNFITDLKAFPADTQADITFTKTISGVKVGDYLGIKLLGLDTVSFAVRVNPGTNTPASYRFDGDVPENNFDWLSQTTGTGYIKCLAKMRSPLVVCVGDSITAGAPANQAYVREGGTEDSPKTAYPFKVAQRFIITHQNLGDGRANENTSAAVLSRMTADVVNNHPRIAIIGVGTADVNNSVVQATYISNMESIMDSCISNGIVPVIILIYPRTEFDATKSGIRDSFNTALLASAVAKGAVVVDPTEYLGVFRSGGPAGNLWDINPKFDSGDGIHLSDAGYTKLSDAVTDALSLAIEKIIVIPIIPKLTTSEKLMITGQEGMKIFDRTLGKEQTFLVGAWADVGDIVLE